MQKKRMRVTCGIIEKDGKYLLVQRPQNTRHALKWEFPGGKIEPEESERDCMARELKEELAIDVEVHERLEPIFREDNGYLVELIPFFCSIQKGPIQLLEHLQLQWIDVQQPPPSNLCEGDYFIIEQIIEQQEK